MPDHSRPKDGVAPLAYVPRRHIERELDLEEESIACRKEGDAPL